MSTDTLIEHADYPALMERAHQVSLSSPDELRKVGALLLPRKGVLVCEGYNRFPRGVRNIPARHARPLKYRYFEHAERIAIYAAARNGIPTQGCTMVVNHFPCSDCARGAIECGAALIVAIEPDWDHPRWGEEFREARVMLDEAEVPIIYVRPTSLLLPEHGQPALECA